MTKKEKQKIRKIIEEIEGLKYSVIPSILSTYYNDRAVCRASSMQEVTDRAQNFTEESIIKPLKKMIKNSS